MRLTRIQLLGMILWRGGLLFASGWALLEGSRWLLALVALPPQLETGAGLILAGAVLVLLSFVLERVEDSRAEGDLRE